MWESENQDESPLMTTDNFHGIDRLVEASLNLAQPAALQDDDKNLGDRVGITIRDSRTGIPTEVREKMFNPFGRVLAGSTFDRRADLLQKDRSRIAGNRRGLSHR